MRTPYGHLTYCTNIHPGESWADHFREIDEYFPAVKAAISPSSHMGIGLRLSNAASIDLEKENNLAAFSQWLIENDAYVFTMNGFPFGGFHNTRVKDQVHAPDWTTTERLDYTLRLFRILEKLLPEGMDGGVSTSPLTYRHWFDDPESVERARAICTTHVLMVAEELVNFHRNTGKILHLDIEPEPDGMLESGIEFLKWFQNELIPAGVKRMAERFQFSEEQAAMMIREHVRLCYDVCHFAIGYEPHAETLTKLTAKGIKIGKFQISAALKAKFTNENRDNIRLAFSRFNENTYLHQVVARTQDQHLVRYADLPEALEDVDRPGIEEWRAHYHVPVSADHFGILQSTHDEIVEVLDLNKTNAYTRHLEVETYTWEVMPSAIKQPLQQSITGELQWVNNILAKKR